MNKMTQMFRYIWYGIIDKQKTVFWWIMVWVILALMLAALFDGFAAESELEEVLQNLPELLLGSLNISQGYFSQVETFVSGQFLTLYTLTGGIFGIFMGVGALRGKMESKYLATVLSYDLSRTTIAVAEGIIQILFWIISGLGVGLVSWAMFSLFTAQETISTEFFFFAMLGSLGIHLFGVGLGMALGMIFRASTAQFIGSAVIAGTWLLNGFSSTPGYPEELKPFSPFYYFDVDLLKTEFTIDWNLWSLLIVSAGILYALSVIMFRKKNI